ncbi:integrase [Candidatus Woesearchaeota archaeon B3_Woes]|nr:MAG: integrase [Candidatus Woesearchaeota archaeon B3_Woes]
MKTTELKNFENELKIRCYSKETIKSYLFFNKKLLEFTKKGSKTITENDVKNYILYMIEQYGAKPATINLAISAFKSYYVDFMKRRFINGLKRAKPEIKEPVILTKNDILAMIDKTTNIKHKLLIELLYSSGLRVNEAVKLKIENIYFEDKFLIVKQGKGKKDRYVIASEKFIKDLIEFLQKRKDTNSFIFISSSNPETHISKRTAEKIVKNAAKKAGIKRNVFCHALRSSFATHLNQKGVDSFHIQKLLGHARLSTTQRYIKTDFNMLNSITSPLD